MLAERFSPEFYEQLARLAALDPNGRSKAVGDLEDFVKEALPSKETEKRPAKAAKAAEPSVPNLPQEFLSEWAKGWAIIDPPLKGKDLRPYVFVTRDKRGYLGGFAAATHLQALAESLLGPRITVRSKKTEVAKLAGSDPEQLFDALRAHILQLEELKALPGGIYGLVLIAEEHPKLQRKLLAFIQELPTNQIGAWAATSWGNCLTDSTLHLEFREILERWSKQSENSPLQSAAKTALQLQKKV